MYLDDNNIVSIKKESNKKLYTQELEGNTFKEFDHSVLVYHKKKRKEIHRKELGEKMNVIQLAKREPIHESLNQKAFLTALGLYNSFNETTGKEYFYLPQVSQKHTQELNNTIAQQINQKVYITYEKQFATINQQIPKYAKEQNNITCTGSILSFLFGLAYIYGKWTISKDTLHNIKIQLPLINESLQQKKSLDDKIIELKKNNIYCLISEQEMNNGLLYQISINDREVLNTFQKRQKGFANINQISKYEIAKKLQEKLIHELQIRGENEIIKSIKQSTIKPLQKN